MRQVIISTAGTSLLTGWLRMRENAFRETGNESDPPLPDPAVMEKNLIHYLKYEGGSSAETASLRCMELDKKYDHLYFISSDTQEGRVCLAALVGYYQEEGFQYVDSQAVPGLGSSYREFQEKGLTNLLRELSLICEKHTSLQVVINATGGFKAQTAFATLFGLLFGIEVIYLYEDFKSFLRFPPVPLNCDRRLFEEYYPDINTILQSNDKNEAGAILCKLPRALQGILEKDSHNKGYQYSPMGRMFIEAMRRNEFPRSYAVRVYKSHATLWGSGVNKIEDITNKEVQQLFYRIFDCCSDVQAIVLDERNATKSQEVFMEYKGMHNNFLKYQVHTSEGSEFIKLEVLPGQERRVLQLLGRKIFP